MRNYFLLIFILFSTLPLAHSNPFEPKQLQKYDSAKKSSDMVRLKISLASESEIALTKVDIDHVIVCSKTDCYRADVDLQLKNHPVDNSILIADALIPKGVLESIYFRTKRDGNIVDSDHELNHKLDLTVNDYGGEIFASFRIIDEDHRSLNRVVFATSTLIQDDITTVHYVPQFPLVAKLKHGVILNFPVKALSEPAIFTVAVDDTGKKYPSVDVYPYVTLLQPVSIKASPLVRSNLQRGAETDAKPAEVPPPVIGARLSARASGTEGNKPIMKMGTFRSYDFENPDVSVDEETADHRSSAYGECASLFSFAANRELIIKAAYSTPYSVVNINWCENIPPYVHMMYYYGGNSQTLFQMPNITSPRPDSPGSWQNLTRIEKLTSKSIAAINGFTWEGDRGTVAGQFGLAQGYVRTDVQCLGDNRQGGGCLGGTGVPDGKKYVMLDRMQSGGVTDWMEYDAVPFLYPHRTAVVSSSTSINRGIVCSGDDLQGRWSAIGGGGLSVFGTTNNILMISSVQGNYTTNANELCQIFLGFELSGSIRMDGGGTVSMTNAGVLMNPLSGLDRLLYGGSRYIAYALAFNPKR